MKILACKFQEFLGNRHLYASFHWSTAFTFRGFVAYSTIHIIRGYIIASGQITHRIPANKELELLILSVQESMFTSSIF